MEGAREWWNALKFEGIGMWESGDTRSNDKIIHNQWTVG